MMKKILHICIFERYREDASYQENLLSQMHAELGYNVFVIASQDSCDNLKNPCKNEPSHYINKYGIDVTILKNTIHNVHISRFFDHCVGLYERIDQIHPDIIFVHNFTSQDVRHIVRYVKEHPSVKVYTDCHSDYYNNPVNTLKQRFNHSFRRLWGQMMNSVSEMMWGTTPWRVQYLQEVYRIPAEKTGLLIMGADEKYIEGVDKLTVRKTIRASYCIPDDAFLVVTGGTLDKRKQQDLLFEAVSQMSEQNVWLLAFGSPTDEMQPVFEKYNSCPNIVMTGWLPAEKAYDMFIASDLAFFPGTHSVLWEQAVACGTPLVVKHWSGMEHVNVNGNAIFLDEVTVDSIKTLISEISSENTYRSMKIKANEIASTFYLTEIAKKAIGINE